MSKGSEIDIEVGRSLRRLRTKRGLTVMELAAVAEISAGMISRVENGQVSPSLGTLQALANAMTVSIMSLFSQSGMSVDVHHVKAGQGLPARRVTTGHAHDYMLLGKHGGPEGSFDAARITIKRDQSGQLPQYQHEGYVFIYMISGATIYSCGPEDFAMQEGDTLSFDAKLPHGFKKIKSGTIEFITVSMKPE